MSGGPWLHGRRGALLLATVVLAALAALTLVLTAGRNREPGTRTPSALPSTTEQSSAASKLPRSDPTSVEVPKIGAKSSLVALGLNPDGTLEVPPVSKPMQAGWYSLGPTPGEDGPAVIVGHVDGNRQKGIFYRLRELAPGDRIRVTREDGTALTFVVARVVARVQQIDKDEFPSDAVYGGTPDPQLRLITCGGSFDRSVHSYRDNIIVYAKLTP